MSYLHLNIDIKSWMAWLNRIGIVNEPKWIDDWDVWLWITCFVFVSNAMHLFWVKFSIFIFICICTSVYMWKWTNLNYGCMENFKEMKYDKILLFKRNEYWNCIHFLFVERSEVKRGEIVQNAQLKSSIFYRRIQHPKIWHIRLEIFLRLDILFQIKFCFGFHNTQ